MLVANSSSTHDLYSFADQFKQDYPHVQQIWIQNLVGIQLDLASSDHADLLLIWRRTASCQKMDSAKLCIASQ